MPKIDNNKPDLIAFRKDPNLPSLPGPLNITRIAHPKMSSSANNMHEDSFASDVSHNKGLMSNDVDITYYKFVKGNSTHRPGMCPTVLFDKDGTAYTVGFTQGKAQVMILNDDDLDDDGTSAGIEEKILEDATDIDERKIKPIARRNFISVSGGAYIFLNEEGNLVVPTTKSTIRVFTKVKEGSRYVLKELHDKKVDLKDKDANFHLTKSESLAAVMPVWNKNKNFIWFTSDKGSVGIADLDTRKIVSLFVIRSEKRDGGLIKRKTREIIRNSYSVDENGVYLVTHKALYHFRCNTDGEILNARGENGFWWRSKEYHTSAKAVYPHREGLGKGSGSTPTIVGNHVVITDCCDKNRKMHLCVYNKNTGKLTSQLPLFDKNRGACENSVIAYKNTVFVGNTYGYATPFDGYSYTDKQRGFAKVEIDDNGIASLLWYKPDIDIWTGTPKLSKQTGMIYAYTMLDRKKHHRRKKIIDDGMWGIIGISYETGEVLLTIPVARPEPINMIKILETFDIFDNGWGPLSIGPDNSIYVGMIKGLLKVKQN